jgi:hypothetical protein
VPPVGVQGLHAVTVEFAALALEIPPGQTVLGGEHHGLGAEKGADVVHHRRDLVRLETEDDEILGAAGAHVAGGRNVAGHLGAAVRIGDAQAVVLNCRQVLAARDEGDLLTGQRQLDPQQSADGTGADDTDLHQTYPPVAHRVSRTHQALPVDALVAPEARSGPSPTTGVRTSIIKSWEQTQVL